MCLSGVAPLLKEVVDVRVSSNGTKGPAQRHIYGNEKRRGRKRKNEVTKKKIPKGKKNEDFLL